MGSQANVAALLMLAACAHATPERCADTAERTVAARITSQCQVSLLAPSDGACRLFVGQAVRFEALDAAQRVPLGQTVNECEVQLACTCDAFAIPQGTACEARLHVGESDCTLVERFELPTHAISRSAVLLPGASASACGTVHACVVK